jgi:hypothetical protein
MKGRSNLRRRVGASKTSSLPHELSFRLTRSLVLEV